MLFVSRPLRPPTEGWLGPINPVPGGCSNVVVRTDLARSVGGFDERLALLADWDLWMRLAEKAAPAVTEEVLMAYRLHPDNMHIRRVDEVDTELDYLEKKHLEAQERTPGEPIGWAGLAWRAKAHRRAGHRIRAARLFVRRWWLTRDIRNLGQAALSPFGDRSVWAVRRRWMRGSMAYPDWLETRHPSPVAPAQESSGGRDEDRAERVS
jgi:hypothetical protein